MNEPIRLLLIEDDEDDVQLLEQALGDCGIPFSLHVIGDGAEGLSYFQSEHAIPHIFILDLNLPKIHGREILKEYRMSKYAHIPLIVLTTSSAKEDIDFSLKNGANKFLSKPSTRQGLKEVASIILEVAVNSAKK